MYRLTAVFDGQEQVMKRMRIAALVYGDKARARAIGQTRGFRSQGGEGEPKSGPEGLARTRIIGGRRYYDILKGLGSGMCGVLYI